MLFPSPSLPVPHLPDDAASYYNYLVDISAAWTRARVARVRAEYPDQLDYSREGFPIGRHVHLVRVTLVAEPKARNLVQPLRHGWHLLKWYASQIDRSGPFGLHAIELPAFGITTPSEGAEHTTKRIRSLRLTNPIRFNFDVFPESAESF